MEIVFIGYDDRLTTGGMYEVLEHSGDLALLEADTGFNLWVRADDCEVAV